MTFLKKIFGTRGNENEASLIKKCLVCGEINPMKVKFCSSCGSEFPVVFDHFDAFISYRRETGSDLASLLKIQLENSYHKKIFLDVKELQVGRFDEALLNRIGETPNFILILSKASLDRCDNKNDWLKREIMHALKTNRNIIPLLIEGFSFPSEESWALLPPEMKILNSLNGVTYSHIHQDAAIRQIATYMKSEVEKTLTQENFGLKLKPVSKQKDQSPTLADNTPIAQQKTNKQVRNEKVDDVIKTPAFSTTNKINNSNNNSSINGIRTITNKKDGTQLVLIPKGEFLAGGPNKTSGGCPPFPVYLSDYYLALYPITNDQYAFFLTENNPELKDLTNWIWLDQGCFIKKSAKGYEAYGGKNDHPVVNVRWEGAEAYCQWAGLRLPSELEWEKGARGIDGRIFPWGNNWDKNKCRYSENKGDETTCSVTSYPEGISPWGLYQMLGNVQEYCTDWFDADAYTRYWNGNLSLPDQGESRLTRGGSWREVTYHGQFDCVFRTPCKSNFEDHERGFRCAKNP